MAFSFPFFKKKPEKHVYFGFYFTESRIMGFAFDIDSQKANILSQNAYDVTAGFDKMVEDTDNLISDLESKTKLPLDKTIFFLHSILLDEKTREIKDPYKETLKKVSKELELEPMGYIDVHEAIEGNMKENSIINNLLLEISSNKLALFVYKGGIMTASHTISRTDSVAADLESALKALPGNIVLPTKIIIYGVGDLTKASADIAQYKWDEKIFVQHPLIEVLTDVPLYQVLADTFVEELLEHQTEKSMPTSQQEQQEPIAAIPPTSASADSPLPFGFTLSEETSPVSTRNVSPEPTSQPVFAEAVVENPSSNPSSNWLSSMISRFSMKPAAGSRNPVIAGTIIGGVIVLAGLFLVYEYFLHTVEVKVQVPTENLSQEFDLSLPIVEAASSDLSLMKHTKIIEYDEEKSTTGKRDVGEKAKGNVILHNFDNAEKSIERGTELKSGNLLFILDSDAKVSSSSGITSDGVKQSGKQKVAVTAKEIGQEYNISKGTQLKVGSLSDSLFIAIADEAFTGGTKKQVTTISKSDMDALKKTVEAEIKKQAESEVEKLKEAKDEIIPELTTVDVTDTEYSGEVGEEAKNISIKASSEINYYTVDKVQLQKRLAELLEKDKKEAYVISEKDIVYTVADATLDKSGEEVELTLETEAKQYMQLDLERMKNDIRMSSTSNAKTLVKSAYKAQDVVVTPSSKTFPFSPPWMPVFKKNISVSTTF